MALSVRSSFLIIGYIRNIIAQLGHIEAINANRMPGIWGTINAMAKTSNYHARRPDPAGLIHYTPAEHTVWRELFAAQRPLLAGRACNQFMDGLTRLELPESRIPQCFEVSDRLNGLTGWQVEAVPALINFERFFDMLSRRVFPAASFIRRREDFDYLEEPDVFHELFGHTPLLTDPLFAEYSQRIGEIGNGAAAEYHVWLARLYWMTIEFGLINTPGGLRAYGAGIISSPTELTYALESDVPRRIPFHVMDALRTPYRIDVLQPVYFVLESFRELAELSERNLIALIDEARERGLYPMPPTNQETPTWSQQPAN